MGTLPEEILEVLSTYGPVQVTAGPETDRRTIRAEVAPLHRRLFLLVRPDDRLVTDLLDDPSLVITAEGPDVAWTLRIRARGVPGRRVVSEPRRAELSHWLPDGVHPGDRLAVHVYADHVDYVRGRGAARVRADGAVPDRDLPGPLARWWELAMGGHVGWFAVMLAADWATLLFYAEPGDARPLRLAILVLGGALLLAGVVLFERWTRFVRWREGLVPEAEAGPLARGWAAPDRVPPLAGGLAALGAVILLLYGLAAGPIPALVAAFGGGAPLLAVFYGVRHVSRRTDARGEAR